MGLAVTRSLPNCIEKHQIQISAVAWRYLCFPLLFGILALIIATAPSLHAANSATNRTGSMGRLSSTELTGGWHLVRTPNPQGGPDAISIMHTADTSRSDLDLAGLMIRCRTPSAEVLIVLLRSFPLRARPHVVVGKPGNEIDFETTIAPPGTAVLFPRDVMSLISGPWQTMSDLSIQINIGQSTIRGVVELTGLKEAFKELMANCRE
jgi:hypothetical protein